MRATLEPWGFDSSKGDYYEKSNCDTCGKPLSSSKSRSEGLCGMCKREINGGLRR